MEGGVSLADATDIVANDVGVALTEVDGFAVRLASGVFDTNAEVMLGLTRTGSGNTAEAFAGSSEWVTETAERPVPARSANLPPRSRALIDEDLARGYIVVARRGHKLSRRMQRLPGGASTRLPGIPSAWAAWAGVRWSTARCSSMSSSS
jgi:hypothetical protein